MFVRELEPLSATKKIKNITLKKYYICVDGIFNIFFMMSGFVIVVQLATVA